jgi:hypothetical protein
MRTAIWPLQEALFQRLKNDGPLNTVITRVYDGEAPEGGDDLPEPPAVMPYIVLGEETVGDYSTKTWDGEDITKTVHFWSSYNGRKETAIMMDLALQAITAEPFDMATGFTFDFVQREFLEILKDNENYHGVMRLRFKIKQI